MITGKTGSVGNGVGTNVAGIGVDVGTAVGGIDVGGRAVEVVALVGRTAFCLPQAATSEIRTM